MTPMLFRYLSTRRPARVPLARQMLQHDGLRLFRSIAGIAFAVLLIFAEIGFLNGLFDNQVELIRQLST